MPEVNRENFQKYIEIINEINRLLDKVREDTGCYSTHIHMLLHPDYQKLVDMGDIIVPYIVHLMTQSGAHWIHFFLLKELTGAQPVPPEHAGRFTHILIDWLQWYVNSKYADTDVYNGLV